MHIAAYPVQGCGDLYNKHAESPRITPPNLVPHNAESRPP